MHIYTHVGKKKKYKIKLTIKEYLLTSRRMSAVPKRENKRKCNARVCKNSQNPFAFVEASNGINFLVSKVKNSSRAISIRTPRPMLNKCWSAPAYRSLLFRKSSAHAPLTEAASPMLGVYFHADGIDGILDERSVDRIALWIEDTHKYRR